MEVTAIVFIIAILITAIWIIFGLKSAKHKLVAFFLISLILFAFFSFNAVFKGRDISVKNMSDLEGVVQLYFSWLGNAFNNLKIITTQAIKMDWNTNSST